MTASEEVSVVVPARPGFLRGLACALGIHVFVSSPSPGLFPCRTCGWSIDREWKWAGTMHDFGLGVSVVRYTRSA